MASRWRLCAALLAGLLASCDAAESGDPTATSGGAPTTAASGSDAATSESGLECTPAGGEGYENCDGVVTRTGEASCASTTELPACSLPDAEEFIGDCITDEHCGAGAQCFQTGEPDICICERPCVTDEECAPDMLCLCGAAYGGRNKCVAATCRGAEDCGGAPCQISKDGCDTFDGARAACRTEADQCQTDADCPGDSAFCISVGDGGDAWSCITSAVCG